MRYLEGLPSGACARGTQFRERGWANSSQPRRGLPDVKRGSGLDALIAIKCSLAGLGVIDDGVRIGFAQCNPGAL